MASGMQAAVAQKPGKARGTAPDRSCTLVVTARSTAWGIAVQSQDGSQQDTDPELSSEN